MGEVLYGDCNGHLRPLSSMYFSLDSRCLVADHPESVQEEVESHFCPHCNSLFTTPDAMSTENRCPQCFECPCCRCVLIPSPVSMEGPLSSSSSSSSYCLRCLYCQWTSEDSGLVAPDPTALAEAASAAARRERESGGGSAEAVSTLLKAAKIREAETLRAGGGAAGGGGGGGRSARSRSGSVKSVGRDRLGGGASSPFSAVSASATGPWKVADLEDAVALRNEAVAAASSSAAPPLPTASSVAPPLDLEADTDGPDPALWTLGKRHETPGLLDRVDPSSPLPLTTGSARGGSGGGVSSRGSGSAGTKGGGRGRAACCSPPRVRLRTRIGKRCRKDLAAGRTGILIKATFNPLEGDSSTANKGVKKKWFKKDCSAALLVPRITVAALPSSLALLGSMATAEQKAAHEEEHHKGGDDDSGGTPSSGGGGDRAKAGEAQQLGQSQASVVLRVVNPQQDTVVRIRVDPAAAVPADMGSGSGSVSGDVDRTTLSSEVRSAGQAGEEEAPRTEKGDGSTAVASEGAPTGGASAAAAAAAAAAVPAVVAVRAEGWEERDWVRLEGKEDEVLRQPGDRHRLPEGALLSSADGGSGGGSPPRGEESPSRAPFLLHQQGDVAWVRVPIERASAERVAAVARDLARRSLVVDVRFSFVMGEGEGGEGDAGGGEVSMPIAVRFPLSSCPP